MQTFENDDELIRRIDKINSTTNQQFKLLRQQADKLKASVAAIEVKVVKLAHDLMKRITTESVQSWLVQWLTALLAEKAELNSKLAALTEKIETYSNLRAHPNALKAVLRQVFQKLQKADQVTLKGILRQLFKKIVV